MVVDRPASIEILARLAA